MKVRTRKTQTLEGGWADKGSFYTRIAYLLVETVPSRSGVPAMQKFRFRLLMTQLPKLSQVISLERARGADQNIALHAWPAARNSDFLLYGCPAGSVSLLSELSSSLKWPVP